MSICSMVLYTRPENVESVRHGIENIEGVEVHAATDEGKLVITLDHPDRSYLSETMMNMHNVPGVINAALIYEYFEESEPTQKEMS